MTHRFEFSLRRFDQVLIVISGILVSVFALSHLNVSAQPNCDSYNGCVTGPIAAMLTGNLTYSFDNAKLNELLVDPAKIQDFKNRVAAAADDFATKTSRTIKEAPSGLPGNVTVTVDNSTSTADDKGSVEIDPMNSARRVMKFSDEWSGWTPEGRNRVASHEWGHVLGLPDVAVTACTGVATVMRKLGPGSTISDLQLRNGYNCAAFQIALLSRNCPNLRLLIPVIQKK